MAKDFPKRRQSLANRKPVTLSDEGMRILAEALEEVRQGHVYTANSMEEMIENLHNETVED
jgi:hypothetical protein